jgi:hypothetical protein
LAPEGEVGVKGEQPLQGIIGGERIGDMTLSLFE